MGRPHHLTVGTQPDHEAVPTVRRHHPNVTEGAISLERPCQHGVPKEGTHGHCTPNERCESNGGSPGCHTQPAAWSALRNLIAVGAARKGGPYRNGLAPPDADLAKDRTQVLPLLDPRNTSGLAMPYWWPLARSPDALTRSVIDGWPPRGARSRNSTASAISTCSALLLNAILVDDVGALGRHRC